MQNKRSKCIINVPVSCSCSPFIMLLLLLFLKLLLLLMLLHLLTWPDLVSSAAAPNTTITKTRLMMASMVTACRRDTIALTPDLPLYCYSYLSHLS